MLHRLGAIRVVPQRPLPSLLGPERPINHSRRPPPLAAAGRPPPPAVPRRRSLRAAEQPGGLSLTTEHSIC